jgi:hypothetical protein
MGKKWLEDIDLKDVFEDYACGTYEIEDVVDEICAQLRLCDRFHKDDKLLDIMNEFEDIAASVEPEETREEAFDATMNKLYDWADEGRKLLIKTA